MALFGVKRFSIASAADVKEVGNPH